MTCAANRRVFWDLMSGGCKSRPISVKRNLKIEANVFVSECTYVSVIALA